MILLAFIASWTVCFLLGFLLRGLLEAEHQRHIPEHPTIRRPPRQLRLVEGGYPTPFDQDRERAE